MFKVIWLSLLVRISIAFFTRTFFQPDEYFQALEPAHHLVFGYGHLTWEWLSTVPIRSITYPALNIPIYWLIKQVTLLGLIKNVDTEDALVILGPRLLHGALGALTDIYLYKLARDIWGKRYAKIALFLSLTSPFHMLALSRSLSNSLESSLTTIMLSLMYTHGRTSRRRVIYVAGLACAIRATNAIISSYIFAHLCWTLRSNARSLVRTLVDMATAGCIISAAVCCVDTLYYGQPTFTPLNFLQTNLSSISSFYGSNQWHYYLSQGLPILCATSLPHVLQGGWLVFRDQTHVRPLLNLCVWTIGVYSLLAHKEWRFIHPILPCLHLFAAYAIGQHRVKTDASLYVILRRCWWISLPALPVLLFVIRMYHAAPIDAMGYLQSLPRSELEVGGVGFLMPCHSTPGQAYLRRPLPDGKLWSLGCEPPLGISEQRYQDQTDIFYASPLEYLISRFPARVNATFPPSPQPVTVVGTRGSGLLEMGWLHEWPRFLVMFGALLEVDGVREVLVQRGYKEEWKVGSIGPEDDERRDGGIVVWAWHS